MKTTIISIVITCWILSYASSGTLHNIIKGNKEDNCTPIQVASFSFEHFTQYKVRDASVIAILLRIIKRYDLIVLIGLNDTDDSSKNITSTLLREINANASDKYEQVISSRKDKMNPEQFSFFFKTSKLAPIDAYQFPTYRITFARAPFSAQFKPTCSSSCATFWLQAVHINSSDVFNEIEKLYQYVFRATYHSFGDLNGIILGNMYADCKYLSDEQFKNLGFASDNTFTFGFTKGMVSTTVFQNQSCTFDNLIAYKTIEPGVTNAKVFNFSQIYQLDLQHSLSISEHYPITMKLNVCD